MLHLKLLETNRNRRGSAVDHGDLGSQDSPVDADRLTAGIVHRDPPLRHGDVPLDLSTVATPGPLSWKLTTGSNTGGSAPGRAGSAGVDIAGITEVLAGDAAQLPTVSLATTLNVYEVVGVSELMSHAGPVGPTVAATTEHVAPSGLAATV